MKLISIKESESKFGAVSKTRSDFYNIMFEDKLSGEMEYDPKKKEILSIFIDKSYRGKGIAKKAVFELFNLYDINEILVLSAKSSLPFWKKVSTKKLKNNFFIICKN